MDHVRCVYVFVITESVQWICLAYMWCMQAAVTECLQGMGSMCKGLLDQLKADAKLAVKQALNANGPFELSPQASCLVSSLVR